MAEKLLIPTPRQFVEVSGRGWLQGRLRSLEFSLLGKKQSMHQSCLCTEHTSCRIQSACD